MRFVAIVCVLGVAGCRPPGYGKGDDAPVVDAAPKPTADAAPDARLTCDKGFRLDGNAAAATVWLTGTFTTWAGDPGAGAIELVKGADDVWTVQRTFDAGDYQYKFIIDGTNWITDPANPNLIDDGFGGQNSVYSCVP